MRETNSSKILIVDDEKTVLTLLTRFLEQEGYQCFTANSVAIAKELLSQTPIDLLLTDLQMPGESGLDLIKFTKIHYPEVCRVMITAFDSQNITTEVMDVGVYGYIVKPPARNVVRITMENALRHHALDLQMQHRQRRTQQALAQRTEKLKSIMEHLHLGVAVYTPDLQILEMNRKMQQWFPRYKPGKLNRCRDIFHSPERAHPCPNCPVVLSFQTGSPQGVDKQFETGDGDRNFRLTTSPILDQKGETYAVVGLYEDITERLLLESDLHQAQKLEAVGQLAAGIAHEINSPIQFVGDNISFLKDSFEDISKVLKCYEELWTYLQKENLIPESVHKKLTVALEEADLEYLYTEIPETVGQSIEGVQRVDKIVRAMKDFSHPGTDEKQLTNINTILESTLTVCKNEWKYVAKVDLNLNSDLPFVPCLPGEISQVFLNIIVNGAHAIEEFTNNGEKGLGTIAVSSESSQDSVIIRISDTGGGIPSEIKGRIFDPFFTTKERGKGTGQGLAIAHRVIVDKHQGTISARSEKGVGTVFTVKLPRN